MTDFFGIPDYVLFFLGLFVIFYLYNTRKFGYWKKKRIPEVPPRFFVGSIGWNLKIDQGKQEQEWVKKYGKVFGIYEASNPVLMVADPDLIKKILVKDFYAFSQQRNLRFGNPILDRGLFAQHGEKWKELRNIISPTFTSGKLRLMSTLMDDCCQIFVNNVIEAAKEEKEIDIFKYAGMFTIDSIARCAFGIKLDSRKDPNNPFVTAARRTISPVPWRFLIGVLFPTVARLFRLAVFDPKTLSFFKDVTLEVVKKRKHAREEEKPRDFLQLLLEAVENETQKFDFEDLVSQCVIFFIAGYIGTSVTITYSAHQLAVSPEIQEKVIKEIDETIKNTGKLDYDAVSEMKYLDIFVQEILRKYSPPLRLERTAVEDYKLDDGLIIEKGTLVAIPVYSLNHDPNYFPDPDKFNPDRFLSENTILPFTNLPFGVGPRNCVGMRFAMMEIKMALAKILQYVKFRPGINTKDEPQLYLTRGFNRPKNVFLKIELRH